MKKYIANTAVSLSVTFANGGYTRVSFSPLSDGTSVYYTKDKEIQNALEHHYKFGKLFRLAEESIDKTTASNKKPSPKKGKKLSGTDVAEPTPKDSEDKIEGPETEHKEVSVTDLDAAKDYLAENFGVVRTKLKTEEAINETALSLGITFKYP